MFVIFLPMSVHIGDTYDCKINRGSWYGWNEKSR
jgi:hypothetical protein